MRGGMYISSRAPSSQQAPALISWGLDGFRYTRNEVQKGLLVAVQLQRCLVWFHRDSYLPQEVLGTPPAGIHIYQQKEQGPPR